MIVAIVKYSHMTQHKCNIFRKTPDKQNIIKYNEVHLW